MHPLRSTSVLFTANKYLLTKILQFSTGIPKGASGIVSYKSLDLGAMEARLWTHYIDRRFKNHPIVPGTPPKKVPFNDLKNCTKVSNQLVSPKYCLNTKEYSNANSSVVRQLWHTVFRHHVPSFPRGVPQLIGNFSASGTCRCKDVGADVTDSIKAANNRRNIF